MILLTSELLFKSPIITAGHLNHGHIFPDLLPGEIGGRARLFFVRFLSQLDCGVVVSFLRTKHASVAILASEDATTASQGIIEQFIIGTTRRDSHESLSQPRGVVRR